MSAEPAPPAIFEPKTPKVNLAEGYTDQLYAKIRHESRWAVGLLIVWIIILLYLGAGVLTTVVLTLVGIAVALRIIRYLHEDRISTINILLAGL